MCQQKGLKQWGYAVKNNNTLITTKLRKHSIINALSQLSIQIPELTQITANCSDTDTI